MQTRKKVQRVIVIVGWFAVALAKADLRWRVLLSFDDDSDGNAGERSLRDGR